jgi:lipopolysaccharide/colanic/teichoic acid biosynthesis glycosyltransferase
MARGRFYLEGKKINAVDSIAPIAQRIQSWGLKKASVFKLPDKRVEIILQGKPEQIKKTHQMVQENIYHWLEERYGGYETLKSIIGNPGVKVSALGYGFKLPVFDITYFTGGYGGQRVYDRGIKRGFDLLASGLGLLAISPLLLLLILGIKLDSKGPILYAQERVGARNKVFKLYKFRTMKTDAEKETGPVWAANQDPRVTRMGHFMRRTNLDELPQLFNVFKGDMSLIGPRPERPFFVEKFRHKIEHYDKRHLIRPGMTGWAQVNGFYGNTSLIKRIEHDVIYIEKESFGLDLKILALTARMFYRDMKANLPRFLKKLFKK